MRLSALACALAVAAACGGAGNDGADRARDAAQPTNRTGAGTPELRDDFGTVIDPTAPATRIVSLNPSVTETLFAMGAGDRMIGRSRWDRWPDAALALPALGDGIRPNVELLLAAKPDLVVLYASADNRAAADRLNAAGVRTLSIKADTLGDFRRVTWLLGAVTGETAGARAVIDSVDASIARVRASRDGRARVRAYYFLGERPAYTLGAGSYLTELLAAAGADNVFADMPTASPVVALEEVVRRDPQIIVAGRAAAARLRTLAAWQAVPAVRDRRIVALDDELIERPGVRMGEAARHIAAMLDSLDAARP